MTTQYELGTTTEGGSFGTGTFVATSSPVFSPNTTYHFRAYATNSIGTGYGEDATFTTRLAAGTITKISISNSTNHNGWVADIDLDGVNVGGSYNFGMGANNDPANAKIVFNVLSQGYNANGIASTSIRTIYGTYWVQKPFPNNSTADETMSSAMAGIGTTTVRIVLSDFIYSGDTNITATIGSGFYTSGSVTSVATTSASVQNNSSYAYPKVIGRWSWVPYEQVTDDFILESTIFNRFSQNGKPIATVGYSCADAHLNTAYATTTNMTVSARAGDANKVLVYATTMPIASFTAGDVVTCNFRAYPWIGDSTSILDSSVGIDGGGPYSDERLGPFQVINDVGGVYGNSFTVVDGTDGATWSSGHANVFSSQSAAEADYASDSTHSWKTIGDAAKAIKDYNNTVTSPTRNDTGGGTVLLIAGNYDWTGVALPADAATAWLTVKPTSSATQASVVINNNSGMKSNPAGTKIKVQGMTVTTDSSVIPFYGGNNSNSFWLHDNILNLAHSPSSVQGFRLLYLTQNGGTAAMLLDNLVLARGNNFTTPSAGYIVTAIGNTGLTIQSWQPSLGVISEGGIYAFNKALSMISPAAASIPSVDINYGVAIVQNIFERKDSNGDPVASIFGGSGYDGNNIIVWHNTFVGNRSLIGYNDGSNSSFGYDENFLRTNWSSIGNIFYQWNNKGDNFAAGGSGVINNITKANPGVVTYTPSVGAFANGKKVYFYNVEGMTELNGTTQTVSNASGSGPTYTFEIGDTSAMTLYTSGGSITSANPARTGGWPVNYHVGSYGDLINAASSEASWSGLFKGLNSVYLDVTVGEGSYNVPGFVSDKSALTAGGTGEGNGDYHLNSSFPGISIIPSGKAVLPFDLDGNSRHNDGSGSIGTYEYISLPSISTSAPTSVSTSTLTLNANISATGGTSVTESGFAYGTDSTLATVISTTTLGSQSTGDFSGGITSLTPNTTYYFRSYAVNSSGTSTGSILATTTLPWSVPDAPTSVIAVSGNGQATISFTASVSDGGSAITQYRAISSPGSIEGYGASSPITLTGLTNGTAYTFTVVAVNLVGTSSESSSSNSITPSTTPTVTTQSASSVTVTGATLNGSITSTGGVNATQSGFAYGTDSDLSTVIATSTLGLQSGTASFLENLTDLTPNTTYYARSYATNSAGTGYGSIISFSTTDSTSPTISLTAPSTGSTVYGSSVTITGSASDNVSISGVEFKLDTNTLIVDDTSSPYTTSWDSTAVAEGTHTLIAVARDAAGNRATSTAITVTVDNTTPPVLSGGSPSGNQTAGVTSATLSVTTDESATCKYSTVADTAYASMTGEMSTSDNTTHTASLSGLDVSSHSYYVRCIDARDNENTDDYEITFTTLAAVVAEASATSASTQTSSSGSSGSARASILQAIYAAVNMICPEILCGSNTVTPVITSGDNQLSTNANIPGALPQVTDDTSTDVNGSPITPSSISSTLEVLKDLPSEIITLVNKFPEIGKTIAEIAKTSKSDVSDVIARMKKASFAIPGISKLTDNSTGIPISSLTATQKKSLPTDVIFAKSGDFIDYSISLSVASNGQAEQILHTVSGKSIDLALKPEKPVKSITGYITIKNIPRTQGMRPVKAKSMVAASIVSLLAEESSEPEVIDNTMVLSKFSYTDTDKDGIYTAHVDAPKIHGEYDIMTIMEYKDNKLGAKEFHLTTVIDPEGYVYEKINSKKEARVNSAKVSILAKNPKTGGFELWQASKYKQTNPQLTDITGMYSFLVPEGKYKLTVIAPGYYDYNGKEFEVIEGQGIHENIEMKQKGWWRMLLEKLGLR